MTKQRNSPTQSHNEDRHLTAEIVSIGDEMTGGARLDTNTQWLSRRLQDLGVEVIFHSTVGDTLSHNVDVFRIAAQRADVVVCTGGLGPTRDDLTREALAQVVDRPLEMRQESLDHIESFFASRNREMPERNRLQAMFPAGSDEIFNPQGTAPGVDLAVPRADKTNSRIFALPGVPAEMKRMFDDTVANRILEMAGGAKTIASCVMKFFGTGESDMEQRLGYMLSRDRQPRVGITVSAATISLRISAMADDFESCVQMIADTRKQILAVVGDMYFGDGEKYEQYHAIDQSLSKLDQSVMVIELGNAAPLGDWFAALGDTSAYRGGISLNSTSDVCRLADVDDLEAAVIILRHQFGADWLLLVDRYPELDHTSDKPLPPHEFNCQVVTPSDDVLTMKESLGGHPSILQQRIAKAAMHWFRQMVA